MVTHGNIGTFAFVFSFVSCTYTVSNVNIDISMIKLENSWHRVRYQLAVDIKIFRNEVDLWIKRTRSTNRKWCIYTYKITGNRTQPNKDIKVLKKHQVNDQLLTLFLSMHASEPLNREGEKTASRKVRPTNGEIFSKCWIKPNLDCNYFCLI